MGTSPGAGYADVVEWARVRDLMPGAVKDFEMALDEYRGQTSRDDVLQGLAETIWQDLNENLSPENPAEPLALMSAISAEGLTEDNELTCATCILEAYRRLRGEFVRATSSGLDHDGNLSHLDLNVGYHDSESEGSKADEVEGVYWHVAGLYELSPAGRRFNANFERKFFVTWC